MTTPRGHGRSNSASTSSAPANKACRFCSRAFAKTEHLIRHERCHTKERPFQCAICGKNYSRNDTLIRHRRTHGNNAATVAPDVFNSNDAATTSDGPEASTPLVKKHRASISSVPNASSPISPSVPQRPDFESNVGPFRANQSFGQQSFPQTDFGAQAMLSQFSSGGDVGVSMPHADPILGGDVGTLDGNGNMGFSNVYLDPALSQYPQQPNPNNYPSLDHLPYQPPQVDQFSTWLVGPDFDLEAFNASLRLSTSDDATAWEWLQNPVPTVELMNLALQLFFLKFNPIFSIFHAPTFRPGNHSSLLLLAICSIGSLFVGTDSETVQAVNMFETLHRNISASWETIMTKPSQERIAFIQAAMLGQAFAYLSGEPKFMTSVKGFQASLIDLSRRCGMFNATTSLPQLQGKPTEELDKAWDAWARSEEILRTALGLYVQDAQFACTFYHAPVLEHSDTPLSVAANDELFNAGTPTRWAHLVRLSLEPTSLSSHLHVNQPEHISDAPMSRELGCKDSRFSCYVILHSIGASVQASKAANTMNAVESRKYQEALICWYHAYEEARLSQGPDPLCLMVLYHEIFMSLLVDFQKLEHAIRLERTGTPAAAAESIAYARGWSASLEAKRCVIHASLIHGQIEGIRFDAELPLHVPRSLFLAALAWYCYIKFDESFAPAQPLTFEESLAIPEIKMFNIDPMQFLPEANGFHTGKPEVTDAAVLGRLTDLLDQIGHWGSSRRFARILRVLVYGDGGEGLNLGV